MLSTISVGGTAVWAVDTGGNLWRREEITPTFPEGTRWSFVCNRVCKVSVGPRDQVYRSLKYSTVYGKNKNFFKFLLEFLFFFFLLNNFLY